MRCGTAAVRFMLVAAALVAAGPARADLADWKGHLAVGFARLFASHAPSGGISVAAGVDYPVGAMRLGPEIGYHLLGTRSLTSGSISANLDYSEFEAALMGRWSPTHLGPLRRLSCGPAVMGASAQVSSSSAGLAFEKDEVSALRPGFALDAAWVPARASAAAVGFELGVRTAFLESDTWTIATARFILVY